MPLNNKSGPAARMSTHSKAEKFVVCLSLQTFLYPTVQTTPQMRSAMLNQLVCDMKLSKHGHFWPARIALVSSDVVNPSWLNSRQQKLKTDAVPQLRNVFTSW